MANLKNYISRRVVKKPSSPRGISFASISLLTLFAVLALLIVVFCYPVLSEETKGVTLTEEIVRDTFSSMKNDDGNNYNASLKKMFEGPLTGTDAHDALVVITDDQCHASGWTELWLLSFQGEWVQKLKLADTDEIDFEVMDINGDGVNEVFFNTWHMSTGAASMGYYLVSLEGGKSKELFEAVGFNNEALWFLHAGEETIHDHFIVFRDIDNDGVSEIIDSEIEIAFTAEAPDSDTYDYDTPRTTSRTDKITIYRFLIDDNGIIKGIEEALY